MRKVLALLLACGVLSIASCGYMHHKNHRPNGHHYHKAHKPHKHHRHVHKSGGDCLIAQGIVTITK